MTRDDDGAGGRECLLCLHADPTDNLRPCCARPCPMAIHARCLSDSGRPALACVCTRAEWRNPDGRSRGVGWEGWWLRPGLYEEDTQREDRGAGPLAQRERPGPSRDPVCLRHRPRRPGQALNGRTREGGADSIRIGRYDCGDGTYPRRFRLTRSFRKSLNGDETFSCGAR